MLGGKSLIAGDNGANAPELESPRKPLPPTRGIGADMLALSAALQAPPLVKGDEKDDEASSTSESEDELGDLPLASLRTESLKLPTPSAGLKEGISRSPSPRQSLAQSQRGTVRGSMLPHSVRQSKLSIKPSVRLSRMTCAPLDGRKDFLRDLRKKTRIWRAANKAESSSMPAFSAPRAVPASEQGASELPAVRPRMVPKGRLQELAVTSRIPAEFIMQAFEIFEDLAVPVRRRRDRWKKGVVERKEYDVLTEGRLERSEGFDKLLCNLTHGNDPSELPEGFIDSAFRSADADGNQSLDFLEFAQWYMRHGFSEAVLLTPEQREIRQIAREHGLPIVWVEEYKKSFDTFDEDGSGNIEFDEFQKLLYKLIKVPAHLDLPVNLVRQFWAEADIDGGGEIGFEEFLMFYTRYFMNAEGKQDSSKHPLEEFYRAIRPM